MKRRGIITRLQGREKKTQDVNETRLVKTPQHLASLIGNTDVDFDAKRTTKFVK